MDPRNPGGRSSRSPQDDPFLNVRQAIDRAFDGISRNWPNAPFPGAPFDVSGYLTPKVNVIETDAGVEMTAELPGVKPEDIELEVAEGVLTLKAEIKSEHEAADEKRRFHVVERSYGTIMRRVSLPFEPEAEQVDAKFEHGVLKVVIPRPAVAATPSKKIPIK